MAETPSGPQESLSCLKGEQFKIYSKNVYEAFEQQIETHPTMAQQNGLFFEGKFVSYFAVNAAAKTMADKIHPVLKAEKAKSSVPLVAIAIDRSDELVVAILAVVSLGYSYLPLDSTSPKDRMKNVLAFAKPLCVLMSSTHTNKKLLEEDGCAGITRIVLDEPELTKKGQTTNQKRVEKIDNDVFAVHFTSGSSGTPKGVIMKHESVMNRIFWQWNTFPWLKNEVAVVKLHPACGDFPPELLTAMLALVPLVVVSCKVTSNIELLVSLLEEYKVHRILLVPSVLRSILTFVKFQHPVRRLHDLKLWVSNSEILAPELANDLMDTLPDIVLAQFYGSTENVADVTYELFENKRAIAEKCHEGRLSIGTPFNNTNIYIVDAAMEVLPVGEVGEICVSGIQCAGYYCPRAGIIGKDKFITNHFTVDANHTVLYKSGDIGKIVDGRIYYYGRNDDQFKILGFTVDPVEVQNVVRGIDGIKRVEVFCYNINEYMPAVVIFYILKEGTGNVKPEDIIKECRRLLPNYVSPHPIEVDSIPLLPTTGKTDRQALRRIFETRRKQPENRRRDGESRRRVLEVIAGVLFLSETNVPAEASFKQLGGDSVSAVQCFVKLREEGFDISLEDVLVSENMENLIEKCVNKSVSKTKEDDNDLHVEVLSDIENQEPVLNIVIHSFLQKNLLMRIMNISYEQFLPRATSIVDSAEPPSVAVTDKTTGELLGTDIFTDFNIETGLFDGLGALGLLFSESERKAKEMIVSKGLLRHSALGVDVDLPPVERMRVILFTEEEAMRRAQKLGYRGVVGCNMNSVMQRVWEENLGYVVLFSTNISQFEVDGKRPFADKVSEDACLKVMIKFF